MKTQRSMPPLDTVIVNFADSIDFKNYPFSLPIIKNLQEIVFPTQVTFFIGENGTGKSTLLEAIACHLGFAAEGGYKNSNFTTQDTTPLGIQLLADQLNLTWRVRQPAKGYFFRAETFFKCAHYLDQNALMPIGDRLLHEQSHGESFFSFFTHRLKPGDFFILDEPEAALSPQRQLSLLALMHELCKKGNTQFIIATHSPILLAYPDATIYSCDADTLASISYTDTEHYQVTKHFLDNPDRYLQYLFKD